MSFKAQFTDAKENFRNSFFDQGKKYYLTNPDDILFAIESSYNTAQRTFTNISKIDKDNNKRKIFESFAEVLKIYFTDAVPEYQSDEDGWKEFSIQLKKWRDIITSEFKNEVKYVITVGQAQKIVNITFKYLYCFDDAYTKKDHFKYCHMALDKYTLEWCKQAQVKGRNGKKIGVPGSWSTMKDDDRYNNIQLSIRTHLSERNNWTFETIYLNENCFKSEFIIWQYMKDKDNLEIIIKSLSGLNVDHLNYIKKGNIKSVPKDESELEVIGSKICELKNWIKK